jgi:hypothetical protein
MRSLSDNVVSVRLGCGCRLFVMQGVRTCSVVIPPSLVCSSLPSSCPDRFVHLRGCRRLAYTNRLRCKYFAAFLARFQSRRACSCSYQLSLRTGSTAVSPLRLREGHLQSKLSGQPTRCTKMQEDCTKQSKSLQTRAGVTYY